MQHNIKIDEGEIAKLHKGELLNAQSMLDTIRECARLTIPSLLPPENQDPNRPLPTNFQSLGAKALLSITGRMLLAAFPPNLPFFAITPPPTFMSNPNVPDPVKQSALAEFYKYSDHLTNLLETEPASVERRRKRPFRTHLHEILLQGIGTGDSLAHMDDDFRLRSFRRDNYTTRRDFFGDVLYHTTHEQIDAYSLDDETFAMTGLHRKDFDDKMPNDRLIPLYTLVEWSPNPTASNRHSGEWRIKQEINAQVINEATESISPYFSFASMLVSGEHYGRGLVELNKGDLMSLDELCGRVLDSVANMTKHLWVIDKGSVILPEDLAAPNNSVILGRVVGGQVQDVASLSAERAREINIGFQQITNLERSIGGSFLLESAVRRDAERVTTAEIRRDAQELESTTPGLFSGFVEAQVPLARRTLHIANKRKLLPALPKDAEIHILSGLATLQREADAARLATLLSVVAQQGPEAQRKINIGVAVDSYARSIGINEPGLIYTQEELAAQQQQEIANQTQLAAAQQAISSTGRIQEIQAQSAA